MMFIVCTNDSNSVRYIYTNYKGIFECFFHGSVCCLLASISRSSQIRNLVSRGAMMSSIKPEENKLYIYSNIHCTQITLTHRPKEGLGSTIYNNGA